MGNALGQAVGDSLLTLYGVKENEDRRKEQAAHWQQQADTARMRAEIQQLIAGVQANSRERVAGVNAGARTYAADAGYAGRTYAADANADARGYAADQGLAGRTYAADRGYAGRTYAADRGLQGARTRAGATVDAAKIGATQRDAASRRTTGAGRDRALTSLYGTLFRPRPTNPLDDAPPAPPSLSDFLGKGRTAFSDVPFDAGGDDTDMDTEPDDGTDNVSEETTTPPPAAAAAPAGAPAAAPAAAPAQAHTVGEVKVFPNGRKGRWDGHGWLAIP